MYPTTSVVVDRLGGTRETYKFTLIPDRGTMKMVLDAFREEVKTPPQRKWRTLQTYDRIMRRDSTLKTEPTIPQHVIDDAIKAFRDMIVFVPEGSVY